MLDVEPAISRDAETRMRLLDAAGQVFAEQGFKGATIRDIVLRAGANVAAVNYHFRDKQNLYREVLTHWSDLSLRKYPPDMGVTADDTPEKKLEAFIRSFLSRVLDRGRPSWFGKLMSREMIEPTPAMEERIKEVMKPIRDQLLRVLRDLLGPDTVQVDLDRAACSVISQCCFYHHSRPMIEKLFPTVRYDPPDVEGLTGHLTRFCLAGLSAMRDSTTPAPSKARRPTHFSCS